MTTDIERQFFETFGIEPEYQDACTVEDKYWDNEELANKYGTFDQYMNCKCGNQENCTTECSCAYQKEIYPQITDRILLELITFLADALVGNYCVPDVDYINLEWHILNDCIKHSDKAYIKQQVQALFKEK